MATTTVKVQRVKNKKPGTLETIYYMRTASVGVIGEKDLVENIMRENGVSRLYAQGILESLSAAIFDYMKAGLSVQVPGLGTFKLNVKSTAKTVESEATARTISGCSLQLFPLKELKEEMANFKFEMVDGTVEDDGETDEVPTRPGGGGGSLED